MRYKCGKCGNIQRIAQLKQAFFSKDDSGNLTCLKCGYDGFIELPIKDKRMEP